MFTGSQFPLQKIFLITRNIEYACLKDISRYYGLVKFQDKVLRLKMFVNNETVAAVCHQRNCPHMLRRHSTDISNHQMDVLPPSASNNVHVSCV